MKAIITGVLLFMAAASASAATTYTCNRITIDIQNCSTMFACNASYTKAVNGKSSVMPTEALGVILPYVRLLGIEVNGQAHWGNFSGNGNQGYCEYKLSRVIAGKTVTLFGLAARLAPVSSSSCKISQVGGGSSAGVFICK